MPYKNPSFVCEPCADSKGILRIKVTCPRCGATHIGNADVIVKWQAEHLCAKAKKQS